MNEAQGPVGIEFEAGTHLKRILRGLRAGRMRIILSAAFGLVVGAFVATLVPDLYEAQAILLIRERELIDNSSLLRSIKDDKTLAQREQTLAQELRSYRWVDDVLRRLEWVEFSTLDRSDQQEFVNKVRDPDRFRVRMNTDSAGDLLVELSFQWYDPRKTRDFLDETYRHWLFVRERDNLEYHQAEYEKASGILKEREIAYEQARVNLEEFQQRENFYDFLSDTTPEVQVQLDLVSEKNRLEAEVDDLEEQIRELESQVAQRSPSKTFENKKRNPEYQVAVAAWQRAEETLTQLALQLKPNHPRYQDAIKKRDEAKLAALAQQLFLTEEQQEVKDDEYANVSGQLSVARASRQGAMERLNRVTQQYDDVSGRLSSRQRVEFEFRNLRNEYDLALEQLNKARTDIAPLEDKVRILNAGASAQTLFGERDIVTRGGGPFSVLEEPVEPKKTVGIPKIVFPLVGALLGALIAFGIIVLTNLASSTYSEADEVARSLGIPVLGEVGHIATTSERRRRALFGFVGTFGSLLLVGSLGYVVYLMTMSPEQLPLGMQEAMESLRDTFR